jgi:uncharacterized protein (DUF2236 family)
MHIKKLIPLTLAAALAVPFLAMAPSAKAAEEPVGVAECDTFIRNYEACVGKMPGAQRDQLASAITQMRTSWRQAATNPQSRAALPQQCTMMSQQMKQQMAAQGCEF